MVCFSSVPNFAQPQPAAALRDHALHVALVGREVSANDVRRRLDALEQGQQRILSLLIEITGDLRRDVGISPPPVGSPHGSAPMFMSPGL